MSDTISPFMRKHHKFMQSNWTQFTVFYIVDMNMEPLKRKHPNFYTKVELINGDCSLPNLGLSDDDSAKLIRETNCIIHCAATVRFDEKIRNATHINVRAVIDLIGMAKQMKNLRAMIHVSTAFSNCIRKQIDEAFYPPPITANKLLALLDALDDDKLDKMTPVLLEEFPNTYVFTKSVAEDVIRSEGKSLPLAVIRPSIVIASVREPVAGWIDNLYGATGVLLGAALGLIRTLHGRKENRAEMVPADYSMNCALAIGWHIAKCKSINYNMEKEEKYDDEVPVYNFVSSPEAPITWDTFTTLAENHCRQIPSPLLVWHYFFFICPNRYLYLASTFLFHTLPAYLVDFVLVCIGKKPMLVKGYSKIDKFVNVITYFSLKEWIFTNKNVQNLWTRMSRKDRETFEFSMRNFNWNAYFYTYVRGSRLYLLKDPLSTIPEGTVKYYKLMVLHYALIAILFLIWYKLITFTLGFIF